MTKRKIKTDLEHDFLWLQFGIDLQSRKIMIDDDVEDWSVGWAIRAIHKMEETDATKPIHITISSYGGSVYDGLGLYDAMMATPCPIYTYGQGKIMSMATTLLLAGEERYSYKSTSFMLHSISDSSFGGKLFEVEIDANETKRLWDVLVKIYVERTKYKNEKYWKRWLRYEDKYLDREQAIEIGLVSHEI